MTTFGNKAAELIAEAAVADDAALPAYNVRRCAGAGCGAARLRRGIQTLRERGARKRGVALLERARDPLTRARGVMRRST